ncbi:MAG: arsenate reductase ArsC [Candidatus Methanoperedens sp.]|nr:arsenate reductase ArsC [Candidatus Methanoperedens sp.]MCE8428120.1 arsenate reductase ArsC [Candidatus Methanoperedens sp.]
MRKVLFVCIENACRSQMAEAFFNKYAKGAIAYSAGSAPAKIIDPKTVEVMKEKGIDLANKKPASFNSLLGESFDSMITMGCKDICPIASKEKTIKWDIEDPKGHSVQKYREIRDIIENKVKELVKELGIYE